MDYSSMSATGQSLTAPSRSMRSRDTRHLARFISQQLTGDWPQSFVVPYPDVQIYLQSPLWQRERPWWQREGQSFSSEELSSSTEKYGGPPTGSVFTVKEIDHRCVSRRFCHSLIDLKNVEVQTLGLITIWFEGGWKSNFSLWQRSTPPGTSTMCMPCFWAPAEYDQGRCVQCGSSEPFWKSEQWARSWKVECTWENF